MRLNKGQIRYYFHSHVAVIWMTAAERRMMPRTCLKYRKAYRETADVPEVALIYHGYCSF